MKKMMLLAALACVALAGCKKDKDNEEVTDQTHVYVAGRENKGNKNMAVIWKDGAPTYLTNGTNDAIARSVYVVGNDVYVAGYEYDGSKNIAKLWKNGISESLELKSGEKSMAYCVFVVGSDVYVGGCEDVDSDGDQAAVIWKNGVATKFYGGTAGNGKKGACVSGIYISGGTVHAVGYDTGGPDATGTLHRATYWKHNGTSYIPTYYSNGADWGYANAIYVVGDDVYVAGNVVNSTTDRRGKVWRNGVPTDLTQGVLAALYSVYVAGGEVYATGSEEISPNKNKAMLWKGTTLQTPALSDGSNNAHGLCVFVSGNDVYVAGLDGNFAKLWKNGQATNLNNGTNAASARSVFVTTEK